MKQQKTCLIALSFGMGIGEGNYGISNYYLAKAASEQDLPVIAQWEIARVMKNNFHKTAKSIELDVGKDYINSYEVMVMAKKYMEELGYIDAVFLSQKDQLVRVKLIAKKLGIKESHKINIFIPCDSQSTQPWTRNRLVFLLREIPTYIIYYLKGCI